MAGLADLDYVLINGLRTPGIAYVQPISQSIEWADSQGFAFDGAVTRFQGNQLKEFSIKFVLVRKAGESATATLDPVVQWLAFQSLLEQPSPGKIAKPVNVSHPYFLLANIRLAVTKSLKGPWYDTETEKGAWVVEWEGKEYRVPKPLPTRLIQPIIDPEGKEPVLSSIARSTLALQAETQAVIATAQLARGNVARK